MRRIIALFVMALLTACLVGCAAPGRHYDDSKVAMIKKDVTTESDLVDWFGPPASRNLGTDGTRSMSWRFAPNQCCASSSAGRLDVRLGADGKVVAYSATAGGR